MYKCNNCGLILNEEDAIARLAEVEDDRPRGTWVLTCPHCESTALEEYYPEEYTPDYTPLEFLKEMQDIESDKDAGQDDRHRWADTVMCDLLRSLGYGEGVEVFEKMKKWYA